MSKEIVEGLLEHHGIKGMKWGVRSAEKEKAATAVTSEARQKLLTGKATVKTSGGTNQPAHADAIKLAEANQKLKRSGPAALSNQELKELAERMNLEQQVVRLAASQPKDKGEKFVGDLLKDPKKAEEHLNTAKSAIEKLKAAKAAA